MYKKAKTNKRRSRKGAWIEILRQEVGSLCAFVAPVRERGLKSSLPLTAKNQMRRSRKGAWIEI